MPCGRDFFSFPFLLLLLLDNWLKERRRATVIFSHKYARPLQCESHRFCGSHLQVKLFLLSNHEMYSQGNERSANGSYSEQFPILPMQVNTLRVIVEYHPSFHQNCWKSTG
ncbi:hypothetical protein BT69DRAFT_521250 [Atractiella rhizophila]|nr:hypothetical protein BT69DRAFT_521250 [Atractiella rhizophila]